MNAIEYIDTAQKLDELCLRIDREPWVALDTEFLREKTYFPKFCLLQIATTEWVACVDPLALSSIERLFETLYQPKILKVFHSCRQDLEIFYHLTGKLPEPIFDTQLAAPLLGYQANPGYGMLVSSLLNINLSKAHTRTDWSVRPLSSEQLQYAADDVIYLSEIYLKMHKQLVELGRLDWLRDDFSALTNPHLYLLEPANAWLRIKGKNKLTGKQLSILQTLAKWREETAQKENRPRNWLLRDDLLIEITRFQPQCADDLRKIRGIHDGTVRRYGHKISRLVNEAKQRLPIKLDESKRASRLSQQQEAVLDVLSAIVRIRAEENLLNPAILATRKDLEIMLSEAQDCNLLQGWRYNMVGRELVSILQGEKVLRLQEDAINILERNYLECG